MVRTKTEKIAACALALLVFLQSTALAEPLKVSWEDLRSNRPASCAVILDNYLNRPNCAQQSASARLLSSRYQTCAPGTDSLDGKSVRIAGYAHPLEFEFRDVKRFLLIPPMRRDCSHPPPPLPDQVIVVDFPSGLNVTADPVWVTGVIRVKRSKTHLVTTTYKLDAISVVTATIPDVVTGG
jgi:hypothetical protein